MSKRRRIAEKDVEETVDPPSGYVEDITIIGAGIGGTYTGWRLRNKGLRIGIYEYSNRVGGRMYTRTFPDAPDLPVDFGAMRIRPAEHVRMRKSGRELGLTFVRFVEETGRIPGRTEITLSDYFTFSNGSDSKSVLKSITAFTIRDMVSLYFQSEDDQNIKRFPNSRQEFEKNTIYPGLPRTVFVPTGMSSYPLGFLRQFLSRNPRRHQYHQNSQLIKISRIRRDLYRLRFRRTRTINGQTIPTKKYFTVLTRNVILALPKVPIQRIQMPKSNNNTFQLALNSVIDVPTSKIFLVYEYPWWLEERFNFTFIQSDLPYRQSFHWGISRNDKAVLLVSYTDLDDVAFWSHLQRRGRVISKRNDDTRVTDEVLRHVHSQISNVYKIDYGCIPVPVDGMMFVWDKYPFNGGWVSWKPGSKSYIKNYLTKPFPQDNIFIVHGYWGGIHNGWGESSLEAADDILTHFGVPSYLSNTLYNKQE